MEKFRSRTFCAVLYPEDPTHVEALKRLSSNGYRYLGIYHDKDTYDSDDENENAGELKKPHYHVIIRFTQGIWSSSLAKELGIAENYLQQCRSFNSSLLYLVHFDIPYKHQYDKNELFGNLQEDFNKALAKNITPEKKAVKVLELVENMVDDVTISHLIKLAIAEDCYDELRRMGSWANRLLDDRRTYLMERGIYNCKERLPF